MSNREDGLELRPVASCGDLEHGGHRNKKLRRSRLRPLEPGGEVRERGLDDVAADVVEAKALLRRAALERPELPSTSVR